MSRALSLRVQKSGSFRPRTRAQSSAKTILNRISFGALIGWIILTTTYFVDGAQVVIACGLAAFAADLLLRGRLPDTGGPIGVWLLAFGCAAVLATTTSIWLGRSVIQLLTLAKLLVVYLLTLHVVRIRSRTRLILWLTVILLAFFPARGAIVSYVQGTVDLAGRADWTGLFGNANALAAIMVLFLPFPIVWIRRTEKMSGRVFWGICIILMISAIVLSKSRSGALGLSAIILWIIWTSRNRTRAAIIVGLLSLCTLVFGPSHFRDRLATITYPITGVRPPESASMAVSNSQSRLQIWSVAIEIIFDHPFLGVGPGTFEEAHTRYYDETIWDGGHLWRDTHNSFLRVWSETGILGIVFFLAIFISCYREGLRAYKRLRARQLDGSESALLLTAALAGLTGFLVTNLFNTFKDVWFLYMYLAILVVLIRHANASARANVSLQAIPSRHSTPVNG